MQARDLLPILHRQAQRAVIKRRPQPGQPGLKDAKRVVGAFQEFQ